MESFHRSIKRANKTGRLSRRGRSLRHPDLSWLTPGFVELMLTLRTEKEVRRTLQPERTRDGGGRPRLRRVSLVGSSTNADRPEPACGLMAERGSNPSALGQKRYFVTQQTHARKPPSGANVNLGQIAGATLLR